MKLPASSAGHMTAAFKYTLMSFFCHNINLFLSYLGKPSKKTAFSNILKLILRNRLRNIDDFPGFI